MPTEFLTYQEFSDITAEWKKVSTSELVDTVISFGSPPTFSHGLPTAWSPDRINPQFKHGMSAVL